MRWVSSDEIFSNVSFGATSGDISEFQPADKYVACLYDDRWYIGTIVKCSSESNNIKGVGFLINILFAQLKFHICKVEVDVSTH